MNKKISVTQKSEGREFIVSAEIISLGGDLLLVITGGKAHIGSVSISQYHKDKNDPNRMTTTTSTIAVLGEKEEIITRDIAAFVSEKTAKNTAVIAGMHWDLMSKPELLKIYELLEELKIKIIKNLKEE